VKFNCAIIPEKMTKGELALAVQFRNAGIEYDYDHKFAPDRRWKFDFLLAGGVVLEVEGAVWAKGRHTRGSGFVKDLEKYNTATMMGFRLFRVTTEDAENGSALKLAKEALNVYARSRSIPDC